MINRKVELMTKIEFEEKVRLLANVFNISVLEISYENQNIDLELDHENFNYSFVKKISELTNSENIKIYTNYSYEFILQIINHSIK